MSDIRDFALRLHARGLELALRRNGWLWIWPSADSLTAEEQAFYRAHRAELVAFVQRNEQPRVPDPPPPPEVEAFARALLARGITLTIRNGRLWVQPGRAYQHDLTDDERAFYRDHRDALKRLVAAGTLPEAADPTPTRPTTPEPPEVFCRHGCGSLTDCARLKLERPSTWRALHYADPQEVARRSREATDEMNTSMRRGTPLRD